MDKVDDLSHGGLLAAVCARWVRKLNAFPIAQ
jgi:hypothetical protein